VLNRFNVLNNPVNKIDPLGLLAWDSISKHGQAWGMAATISAIWGFDYYTKASLDSYNACPTYEKGRGNPPVPPYRDNKQNFKQYNKPLLVKDVWTSPPDHEPPGDDCEKMERFLWSDKYSKLPFYKKIAFRIAYFLNCN